MTVLQQDPVATMSSVGTGVVHLHVAAPGASSVSVTLFAPLSVRGQIGAVVANTNPGTPAISSASLSGPPCGTRAAGTLLVVATGVGAASTCQRPVLHLACAITSCSGVYPLRYVATNASGSVTTWSLLGVNVGRVTQPLRVVTIVDPQVPVGANAAGAVRSLQTVAAWRNEPVAIAANYASLLHTPTEPSTTTSAWRTAYTSALASPEHVGIIAPPRSIDFGGMAANGFDRLVGEEFQLTSNALTRATGRYAAGPAWLGGTPTYDDLAALGSVGIREAVVPDTALSPNPSTTLLWGSPEVVSGTGVTVLALDTALSQIANTTTIAPALRAILAINTLSVLHFDAPNATGPRTVVVGVNAQAAGADFLHDFFYDLGQDPFAHGASLSASFSSALVGANGVPTTWSMAATSNDVWSATNSASLHSLLTRTTALAQSVTNPEAANVLTSVVALAPTVGSAASRQGNISRAGDYINGQIGLFRIDDSTVTLTSQGTALPITLISHAHYPITVRVQLVASSLDFVSPSFTTVLSKETTALRVPLKHAWGSNVTLRVYLTTANGRDLLAHTALLVRVAGTSFVGYLISVAALGVLFWWWLRTYRRSKKGKHAS